MSAATPAAMTPPKPMAVLRPAAPVKTGGSGLGVLETEAVLVAPAGTDTKLEAVGVALELAAVGVDDLVQSHMVVVTTSTGTMPGADVVVGS